VFEILFTLKAKEILKELKNDNNKQIIYQAVVKSLKQLNTNPKHNGLNSHEFYDFPFYEKIKIWESYAQNHTPGAYRIFWHYGPNRKEITIIDITPHP